MSNADGNLSAPQIGNDGVQNDPTSPRNSDPTSDWMVKTMRTVRLATAVAGIAVFLVMLFSILYYVITFSLACVIISIYLTPIGCVIFVIEWRKFFYDKVIEQFPFLTTTLGRGALYLFVGGQCMALESIWGYILGAFFFAVGAFNIFYAMTKERHMNASGTQMQDIETPEPVMATETVAPSGYPSSDQVFSHQDPFSSSPYAQNEAIGVAPVTVTSSAQPAEPGSKSLADLDDNPFNKTSL